MDGWEWLGDVPVIGGALLVIAGVVATLIRAVPFVRRLGHFVDDWFGETGRPGGKPTPGVLERLTAIENRLARVEGQFSPNGGGSLRDAVNRVEAAVTEEGRP